MCRILQDLEELAPCGRIKPLDKVGRRSTLGPRLVNCGSPIFGGQPWVPAQKSSTVGPRHQFTLLRSLGNQTKLSTFDTVAFRVRRRPDRFHALRRAPPLHSSCQKFGNTDYFLKIPAKAKMSCSMKHGRQPSNQLRGAQDAAAHACSTGLSTGRHLRESVLFIGTQFSILYTFVYSPA